MPRLPLLYVENKNKNEINRVKPKEKQKTWSLPPEKKTGSSKKALVCEVKHYHFYESSSEVYMTSNFQ